MLASASVYAHTMLGPAPHQLTRAEVMHELYGPEDAGYNPSQGDDSSYPVDIQAIEAKVAAKDRAEREALLNTHEDRQTTPAP